MKGFIEIKGEQYEDTIEHLYRIKKLACKLIKKLAEHSEVYDEDEGEDEEVETIRTRKGRYVY
jgi:hypothetical protein